MDSLDRQALIPNSDKTYRCPGHGWGKRSTSGNPGDESRVSPEYDSKEEMIVICG